nr:MAG TPA: hypothetical protein [Caudoviricetes sp.]
MTNYSNRIIFYLGQRGYIDRRKRMPWDDYPEALTYLINFRQKRRKENECK